MLVSQAPTATAKMPMVMASWVDPTCHNTNKSQTLEGEPFGLMKPHSKARRDGYFKR